MSAQPPLVQTFFSVEAVGGGLPHGAFTQLDLGPAAAALQAFATKGGGGNAVANIGTALQACLAQHQNMALAFAPVAGNGAVRRVLKLNFGAQSNEAKDLPWEALRNDQGFLSLEGGVPILREFGSPQLRQTLPLLETERFRMLAVIAARGNDGRGEWDAIREAVAKQSESFPIEVLVLTSKPHIRAEIDTLKHPSIRAEAVPEAENELVRMIGDFAPHLAHFFCHGHAGVVGKPLLEIEPSAAFFGGTKRVWLSAAQLEKSLLGKVWVTVLNACSLGDLPDVDAAAGLGAGETSSLCERLISMGFPLVIGMRDLVQPEFAHAFAREFYHRAFVALASIRGAGSGALDLGESFTLACQAIAAAVPGGGPAHVTAASRREWTLPVMTVRDGEVEIAVLRGATAGGPGEPSTGPAMAEQEELLGEIEGLRGFVSNGTLTVEQENRIKLRIAELEAALLVVAEPSS